MPGSLRWRSIVTPSKVMISWNCGVDGGVLLPTLSVLVTGELQESSAARNSVVTPGTRHDAETCNLCVVGYGGAYYVGWATRELKAGVSSGHFSSDIDA